MPSKGKNLFSKAAHELIESEHDKGAKASRENQQILIYIFVSGVIVAAWGLGLWQVSFIWIFFLILITFAVWYGKVLKLTEAQIKSKELLIHRKRALRQSETAEWLNFVLNRWWVFSSKTISDIIKRKLDPVLSDIRPSFLDDIQLLDFNLGEKTPFIRYVHVYEYVDGGPGGKKAMSWSNVTQPPAGLVQAQQYQVVMEADVGLNCDDFSMVFRTHLGAKSWGINLDFAVEKLNLAGKMQFIIHLDMNMTFPHVSSVTLSFIEKPEVWFAVRVLKTFQMMEIPIIKSWIHHLVMDGLTQALVDPGKIDLKFEATGPSNIASGSKSKANAHGVLTVSIIGENSKGAMLVEETRYCQLRLGEEKKHTRHMQTIGSWQDHCSFLVDDIKSQKLKIKSKTKVLLSTCTLAQFEVSLADFPFEHRNSCHTVLEEKAPKTGGPITLELDLEYTPLPPIDEFMEKGKQSAASVSEMCGVMYVCLHSANNLLGLDRNGSSDPYCVLYSNGKKVKTTHYINSTRNPKWNVSVEFIVSDFTKSMLSFIVYDWDGNNASEDDFLGSAHVILSKEEPAVIRENLTLGYNLFNTGQVDNPRLGYITVSVIFRPTASVLKSEADSVVSSHVVNQQTPNRTKRITTAFKRKLQSFGDRKLTDHMGVGGLLSQGHGILELHIIQAKELVAMDHNGFSDPYCEVKISGERKFTTSVKKKTLDPIWNEFVTLQLPKPGENLEIIMWDKDPFFQKDFLGSLTFSLDDLKKFCADNEFDGWHALNRIRRGQIQLKINVIMEEPSESEDASVADSSAESTIRTPRRSTLPLSKTKQGQSENITGSFSDTDVAPRHRTSSDPTASNSNLANSKNPVMLTKRLDSLSDTKYYGVQGQVLGIKGLRGNTSSMYCKLRLDARSPEMRRRKESRGKVIAKSSSVMGWAEAHFNIPFQVDSGHGVLKDSLLVFDVKTSQKHHLATRGYTLRELLGERHDVTKWVPLNDTIELEVTLIHTNTPHSSLTDKQNRGIFSFRRVGRSLSKVKEV